MRQTPWLRSGQDASALPHLLHDFAIWVLLVRSATFPGGPLEVVVGHDAKVHAASSRAGSRAVSRAVSPVDETPAPHVVAGQVIPEDAGPPLREAQGLVAPAPVLGIAPEGASALFYFRGGFLMGAPDRGHSSAREKSLQPVPVLVGQPGETDPHALHVGHPDDPSLARDGA